MKIPGPDHPITIAPAKTRWRALFAGHVIAATLGHENYEHETLVSYAAPGSRAKAVAESGLRVLNGGRK